MKTAKLIVFSGLPGVGKSTLAERVAQELAFPLFSVDPIESALLKSGLTRSFETGLAAYLVAETLADAHLTRGLSVIIDAVNPVQEARDMWQHLAEKHHVVLHLLECVCEPHLHQARIAARSRQMYGLAEVTWEEVEQRRASYVPWTEARLVIDTAQPLEACVQQAIVYVSSLAERA